MSSLTHKAWFPCGHQLDLIRCLHPRHAQNICTPLLGPRVSDRLWLHLLSPAQELVPTMLGEVGQREASPPSPDGRLSSPSRGHR